MDAFRGAFPYARTDLGSAQRHADRELDRAISSTLINEFELHAFARRGLHQRLAGTDLYTRQAPASTIRTSTLRTKRFRTRSRRSRLPISRRSTVVRIPRRRAGRSTRSNNATTFLKGRHTFKAGVVVEYSGQDDFDQINVQPIPGSTNNQNGRFQFPDTRAGGTTGVAMANAAHGAVQQLCGDRAAGLHQVSLAEHGHFVQDSWRPTGKLTVEGGVRWAYWPPWYSIDQQHRHLRSCGLRHGQPASSADDGPDRVRSPLQRHRASWRRIRGGGERPCGGE